MKSHFSNTVPKPFPHPFKAFLRVLHTKCRADLDRLLTERKIKFSELLAYCPVVEESFLAELSLLAVQTYQREATFGLEAAYLFQPTDLEEEGWLITPAKNILQLSSVIQKIFPRQKFSNENRQDQFVCNWTPQDHTPEFVVHFVAAATLIILQSQGIPTSEISSVIIPEWCAPVQHEERLRWQDHFYTSFKIKAVFKGSAFEVHVSTRAVSLNFKNADKAMFKLFDSRSRNDADLNLDIFIDPKGEELVAKIRTIMLSQIENRKHCFGEVAENLGVSVRTLERTLAKHHYSLRKIKQDLQCSTATELLQS